MYLLSIYFDEKSNEKIRSYMYNVAEASGNSFMTDNNVPPHITIAAFNTKNEEYAIRAYNTIKTKFTEGNVNWVSVGNFGVSVVYITPVLNEYLHNLCTTVYHELGRIEEIDIDNKYTPFNWLPHTTIAKTLSKEQQLIAISTLQDRFCVSNGHVVKIGLARTNPYIELNV